MNGDMFRPPVNRAMRTLDASFFQKRIPLSAARVSNNRDIAPCRKALEKSKEALILERLQNVRPDPEAERAGERGRKCILLRPEVKHDGMTRDSIWSH